MILRIMRYANIVERFFAYHTRARACVRLCGKVFKHMRVDMFAAAQGI